MEFTKYSSIENTYRKELIARIRDDGLDGGDWIVEEKVHGANMSVWYDGERCSFASRTAFLDEPEKFYGAGEVLDELCQGTARIHAEVAKTQGVRSVAVFGELFGGSYSHPEVEIVRGMSRVQRGVFYSPRIHFIAFDVMVDDEFVDYDRCQELLAVSGLFQAEPLMRGSLHEALAYPNAFESTIAGRLGLPLIEGNICEGVVIRPVEVKRLGNGDRVILKNKNEKYKEKGRPKAPPPEELLSEEGQRLYAEMESYVTANRLENVLSKFGPVTMEDMGKVLRAMNGDVMEDFMKDFSEEFALLSKTEQNRITKGMNKTIVPLVKTRIINGSL